MRAYNERLCIVCLFWKDLVEHRPQDSFIINNHLISIRRSEVLDFTTKMFYILADTGDVYKGEKLEDYGEIPQEYRSLLKNNAQFVSKGIATKAINNKGFKCMRLGCWDRTHCLFYAGDIMDWNEIPASHKIGDELCEIFINKIHN
jgi:hypothetical protein